jgi:hypothetical protein
LSFSNQARISISVSNSNLTQYIDVKKLEKDAAEMSWFDLEVRMRKLIYELLQPNIVN